MNKPFYPANQKLIFVFSLFISIYFLLLIMATELNYNTLSTGILREFLTLPVLLTGLVLLVLTARTVFFKKYRTAYPVFSFLLLLATTIMMILYTLLEK